MQIRREAYSMSAELETRVLRRITLRIVPFVMLLYFIAFIDRVNIGFAALTMNKDLGFSPTVFGFGAGIFFIGYALFQVIANVMLEVDVIEASRRPVAPAVDVSAILFASRVDYSADLLLEE